jgi:hypothetical protein
MSSHFWFNALWLVYFHLRNAQLLGTQLGHKTKALVYREFKQAQELKQQEKVLRSI